MAMRVNGEGVVDPNALISLGPIEAWVQLKLGDSEVSMPQVAFPSISQMSMLPPLWQRP